MYLDWRIFFVFELNVEILVCLKFESKALYLNLEL